MKIKSFFIIFIISASFIAHAQNNNCIKVDSLSINNKNLLNTIDSIISKEKLCEYYNDNLSITIYFQNYNPDTISVDFSFSDTIYPSEITRTKGFFKYRNHIIIIISNDSIKTNKIFSKTHNNKIFVWQEKTKRYNNYIEVLDDFFPTFSYFLVGDKFIFESGYPPCPRE